MPLLPLLTTASAKYQVVTAVVEVVAVEEMASSEDEVAVVAISVEASVGTVAMENSEAVAVVAVVLVEVLTVLPHALRKSRGIEHQVASTLGSSPITCSLALHLRIRMAQCRGRVGEHFTKA